MSDQQNPMQQMLLKALGVGPDFHEQIKAFAQAIVEMDRRTQRIETMVLALDRRLTEFGIRADDYGRLPNTSAPSGQYVGADE